MAAEDDPEARIRELERPLADAARASEIASSQQPAGQLYSPGSSPPPQRPSGNRAWWILGTVIVVGMLALAGGIAAFAAHQFSGVRSIIESRPTPSKGFGPPASSPTSSPNPQPSASRTRPSAPSTSAVPPQGGKLSVSGINENRTLVCNDSMVTVSGVSNTVVITGHCARISVSGVQNTITVDAVDSVDASGFNNKVTYHSGSPQIGNVGDSNVVEQG